MKKGEMGEICSTQWNKKWIKIFGKFVISEWMVLLWTADQWILRV
jgi:hypothetical protein